MIKYIKYLLIVASFTSLFACSEKTKGIGSVQGIVTDADSGEPIRSANITTSPLGRSTVTGSDGRYEFRDLEEGQYTIQAVKSEYESNTKQVIIKAGQMSSCDIMLSIGNSKMKLSESSLNFGTKLSSMSFNVMNVGASGILNWSISSKANWFSVSPESGSTDAGKSTSVVVTIDRNAIQSTQNSHLVVENMAEGTSISLPISVSVKGDDGGETGEITVPNGLISYYTFDGDDVSDITENEADGQGINDPSYITSTPNGKGKAIFLNATKNQYLNIPYNLLKGMERYSISFWIKDFGTGLIFSAISEYHIGADFPRLLANSDGKFTFYSGEDYDNRTTPFSYSYTPIQSSEWHNITIVCDKKSNNIAKRYLYIDGKLVDNNEGCWSGTTNKPCTKFQLGGSKKEYYATTTSLKLDNVRFYSRALTSGDITKIYNSEK